MPEYTLRDPATGRTLTVRGDSPPTEQELEQLFRETGAGDRPPDFKSGTVGQTSNLDALERFMSGAWKNLNPVTAATGLYGAVRHPIDTGKAIGNAQYAELEKALNDLRSGHYSEMVGHGIAGALPIIGPAAAAAGERIGSGDVAGGLGESAGLLAPFGAGPAMRGARAVAGGAAKGARALPGGARVLNAAADMADTASVDRIVDVMAPKVGANKTRFGNKAAKIAPQIAREADLTALSREGLARKVEAKLADATSVMDDAADARLASQQVKTAPLLKQLDEEIAQLTATPADASQFPRSAKTPPQPTRGQQLDGITGELSAAQVADTKPYGTAVEPSPNAAKIATLRQIRSEIATLGPVAPYESVRRVRQAWDQVSKPKYLPSTAADALKSQGEAFAAERGTAAMRQALADTDPASAAAYKDYSLYKAAHDVLTATEEAERVRPKVGRRLLGRGGGAIAGAEAGGWSGAVVGSILGSVLERAVELAPTTKILIARKLASVADLLRANQPAQAQAALRQAGKLVTMQRVVKRTAVPTGRIVDRARLPMAADDQSQQPGAIGQR